MLPRGSPCVCASLFVWRVSNKSGKLPGSSAYFWVSRYLFLDGFGVARIAFVVASSGFCYFVWFRFFRLPFRNRSSLRFQVVMFLVGFVLVSFSFSTSFRVRCRVVCVLLLSLYLLVVLAL